MLNRLLILGAKTDYSHSHCTLTTPTVLTFT